MWRKAGRRGSALGFVWGFGVSVKLLGFGEVWGGGVKLLLLAKSGESW